MSGSPEIIHHYDSATAKRGFWPHAWPMLRYPIEAWRSRELVWNFFRRELLGRFRGSLGGIFWVLVQPLFQFAIYFIVFGILFGPKGELLGEPSKLFAVYLFSGIVTFSLIQEGTSSALNSVVANGNLVRKVVFPCELLPLTPVLVSTVVYLVGTAVLIVVGLVLGNLHFGWQLLAWPLLLVCLVVFTTGLGMLLAAAQVLVRDVSHLYGILTTAWFFLSPNFWTVELIRGKAEAFGMPWVIDAMVLNPAYCLVMAQRHIFGFAYDQPPAVLANYYAIDLGACLGYGAAWALVTFFVGYGFFMSRKLRFADLV